MTSNTEVEKGMKMAEQEMEYRVDLFNKYATVIIHTIHWLLIAPFAQGVA